MFLLGVLFYMKIYFVLIDHLSETICLFYFCVLFSNIYPEISGGGGGGGGGVLASEATRLEPGRPDTEASLLEPDF